MDLEKQKVNSPERKIQREKWERCNNDKCIGFSNWTKCLRQCARECKWIDRASYRGEVKGLSEW